MRTNIEIDDGLMTAAMAAGDFKTKKEAVEEGLRLLARQKSYQNILALRGKLLHWDVSAASQPKWERSATQPASRQTVRRATATSAKTAKAR
jgi:Arc/MetJ family transcription regulator